MRWRTGIVVLVFVSVVAAACAADTGGDARPADTTTSDPDGGYPPLAPPTTRPVDLDAADLTEGFFIEPFRPGGCRFDYQAQVARLTSEGEARWVLDVPWPGYSAPVVVGDVSVGRFGRQRDGLFAVDVTTGAPAWQRYFDERSVEEVVFGDDVIAVRSTSTATDTGIIEVFGAATGDLRTQIQGTGFGDGFAIRGDLVVAADDNDIVAYGADGAVAWTRELPSEEANSAGVVVFENHIVARQWPATLHGLSPDDGATLWSWEADDPRVWARWLGSVDGRLVAELGFSYTTGGDAPRDGSTDGVVVIDLATGAEVWSRYGREMRLAGSVLLPGEGRRDQVDDAGLAVVDVADGATLWLVDDWNRMGAAGDDVLVYEAPWQDGDPRPPATVVSARDGADFWSVVDAGEVVMLSRAADMVFVGLSTSNNSGVVTDDPGGVLIALDSMTAEERWRLQLRDPFNTPPHVLPGGDLLVVASDPGIFCD